MHQVEPLYGAGEESLPNQEQAKVPNCPNQGNNGVPRNTLCRFLFPMTDDFSGGGRYKVATEAEDERRIRYMAFKSITAHVSHILLSPGTCFTCK